MDLTQAVLEHPYLVLGLFVLIEGPAATITAGTLVGAGAAAFWPIWVIVALAEVVGDSLLYLVGRSARRPWVASLLSRLKATALLDRLAGMSLPRLVITAKLVDVFALPAFVSAGLAGLPYRRFAAWVGATAAVRGLVLIGLGALFGSQLSGLLALPGGIFLLTAAVAVPVAVFHLVMKRYHRRKVVRPMRILIGADTYAPHVNGASYFAQRLAVALTARHEVHVVAPSTDTRNHAGMSSDGVVEHRVRSLPVPGHSRFRFCPPLGLRAAARRILDEIRPDVVHVQSHFPLCRALVDTAHERDLFVIATNHFMPENLIHYLPIGNAGRTRAHEWAWRDAARVFAKADIVTAPTPYAAALAVVSGVSGPVLPISCGIDLTRFREQAPAAEFRWAYSLAHKPTITYVGRLDAEKNLDVVMRAFALVRRSLDVQLLLVGTGSEGRALRSLAGELGVAEHVTFTGFIPDEDLPSAYAASAVFVNAGTAELQSLVTLEAMASGRPVIGADAAALPHLVRDKETGYLFPPGDVVVLAERLLTVLCDPKHADELGHRARAVAEQHDQTRTVSAFEQLYRIRPARESPAPAEVAA
ncbi:glycosyltransferase [Micromonospora sp. C51]|uniref:glycosyltransferase n=1 Tax=Micromonospora sp. C51 TaxID=2824879 RepID=UPI001B399EC3|nr:glycosyltransferase [Micromonospora sp. C51]MBQ1047480.1 glycosyltransferase [Micromonospora sp. C51]